MKNIRTGQVHVWPTDVIARDMPTNQKLISRTKELLREWQADITNPMRGWGELDCLIELRILDEMERDMPKKKEIPVCGAVATVRYRDGAYYATISTDGERTYRASCTVSASYTLQAALDKWKKSEAKIALKMGISYGE